MRARLLIVGLITVAGGFLPCYAGGKEIPSDSIAINGSPQRGRVVIEQFRCGSCHIVPGIPNADGMVGPPLNQIASRTFIAGEFQNNLQTLIRWIQAPTSMKPKTDMPDLGLTEQQAADVAAYLERLH